MVACEQALRETWAGGWRILCDEKSYLLPIGKEADGATFAEPRHHSHQLFEWRIILRHQIVDDRSPAANARDIHLKEIQIQ